MPMAVLGTAAGLLGAYAVASWVVYDRVSRAAGGCWPDDVDNTPSAYRVRDGFDQTIADRNRMPAPADVRFRSRDPAIPDLELAGWWLPADKEDAPAVVVVHGVQSCRREANVLVPAGMLHRAGFSVFLIDARDHGDSDGHDGRFAAGTDEHLDVLGAWDWVRAQGVPAARIGLLGMSFGAINSVIAGGEDRRVAAVWADSVATRMGEAIGNFVVDQLGDPTGVSRLLVPGGLVWARIIAGDDLTRYDPIDEVGRYADRWIAFVQGEEDRVLPPAMADAMHGAAVAAGARTAPLWVAPGAGHGEALFFEPDAYERRLVDFFTDALGEP
ncbi:MAG TPA: alpha/beta hydrolase [Candidatus Limnocylindrales bacterium]|nr:alpha/beta hydrolase [Candidatus Limnocylindrales bacterium]